MVHYSSGPFGVHRGGPRWTPYEERPAQRHRRVIYYTPYVEYTAKYQFNDPDKVVFAKSWDEVMQLLDAEHKQRDVSIITDGSIAYFKP